MKGWNDEKHAQLVVISMVLRGKLIDNYVELMKATKAILGCLKVALQDRVGIKEVPLAASKQFNQQTRDLRRRLKILCLH